MARQKKPEIKIGARGSLLLPGVGRIGRFEISDVVDPGRLVRLVVEGRSGTAGFNGKNWTAEIAFDHGPCAPISLVFDIEAL